MRIRCAKCRREQRTDSVVGEDFNCKFCGKLNTIGSSITENKEQGDKNGK